MCFSDSESVSEVIGSPNPEYLSTSQVAITTDTLQNSLATPATETDISSSPDDLTTSCSDYADTPPPVLQLDSLLDCASSPNTSTTKSLNNSDMDTPVTIPKEPYNNKIMDILNNAGWDFNRVKKSLRHIMASPDVLQSEKLFEELVFITVKIALSFASCNYLTFTHTIIL